MNKLWVLVLGLTAVTSGCAKSPSPFEMTVSRVDKLEGFILKGISITGTVSHGCIANEDIYIVRRKGEQVFTTDTRIVNVEGLKDPDAFDGKVFEGNVVTFYIPDGKLEDVLVGDEVSSEKVSCAPTPKG